MWVAWGTYSHTPSKLEVRQRALKWNFNELQYALPPSVIFPFDFKSGCLWMLTLSAMQSSDVLKTVSDLCVTAKVDQNFSCSSPISPLLSHLLSKDCKQADIRPFPVLAAVTSLSFSQAEYRQCDLFLSTHPHQTSRPDAVCLSGYLVEVTMAWAVSQYIQYMCWSTNTDSCSTCMKSVLK